jgi:hypothetical protein
VVSRLLVVIATNAFPILTFTDVTSNWLSVFLYSVQWS